MRKRPIEVHATGPSISGPGGVSISGHNSGDITTNVHMHVRQPVTWPHHVGVIPQRAASFQAREAVRALRLQAADPKGLRRHVLCGTGGVGKTQVAAEFARDHASSVDLLIWISAKSAQAITAAYMQAAVDIFGVDPVESRETAQAFLAWLQSASNDAEPRRWLIVLDDVQDPADLHGLWPPESPHGRTIITSRRRDDALTGNAHTITVGLYSTSESLAYLAEALAARERDEPTDELERLADALGHLPLALSQAVAYLIDAGMTCQEYRALLSDRTARLEDLEPDALPDDQPHAVHAAWYLSIERANQLKPTGLAEPMLQLTAVLDSNGIPETVLTSQPALDYLTAITTPVPKTVTEREARLCLRALHRLCLIDHNPKTPEHAVRVHQLIQRTIRESETPDQHFQATRAAADALHAAWPATDSNTELAHVLRACAWNLLDLGRESLFDGNVHPVLFRWGESLSAAGDLLETMRFFSGLESRSRRQLGSKHRDTLTALFLFAECLRQAESPRAALDELQEVLTAQIHAYGPEDPDVFRTRLLIARCQSEAGDPHDAIATYKQVVADETRIRGADHKNTLAARQHLAVCRARSQQTDAALADYQELLSDYLRIYGASDDRTFTLRMNLATCHARGGQLAQAITDYEQLLADMEQALGPNDEKIIDVLDVLSYCQAQVADWASAMGTLERLIPLAEAHWGSDHPNLWPFQRALASCEAASML